MICLTNLNLVGFFSSWIWGRHCLVPLLELVSFRAGVLVVLPWAAAPLGTPLAVAGAVGPDLVVLILLVNALALAATTLLATATSS